MACIQEMERAVKAEGPDAARLARDGADRRRDADGRPQLRLKEPVIKQIFIGSGPDVIVPDALERKLYVIRKTASAAIQALKLTHSREYYVPSMSCRHGDLTRACCWPIRFGKYYKGFAGRFASSPALALVHQRFSTNTFPELAARATRTAWSRTTARSTPSRATSTGCARAKGVMKSPVLGDDLKKLYPISFEHQSDTATFDNALELLVMSGYSLAPRPR